MTQNKKIDVPFVKGSPPYDIVFITGETSGDLLGEQIITQLQHTHPHLRIGGGIAGPAIRSCNIVPWFAAESFHVMGLFDVLKKGRFLYSALQKSVIKILETSPKIIVCIDQPSFSIALAKRLRAKGFLGKLVQVVAPTVWAYKPERAKILAQYFDLLLPLYRFEVPYFTPHLKTVFAGHPLASNPIPPRSKQSPMVFALFPGSRPGEIIRNFPLQAKLATLLKQSTPELSLAISTLPHTHDLVLSLAQKHLPFPFKTVDSTKRYDLMSHASASIATSGTVTLELALHNVPTICCYQTNLLSRLYARYILKLHGTTFALPNILSKASLFPEYILPPIDVHDMAKTISPYLRGNSSLCQKALSSLYHEIYAGEPSAHIMAREITCLLE